MNDQLLTLETEVERLCIDNDLLRSELFTYLIMITYE